MRGRRWTFLVFGLLLVLSACSNAQESPATTGAAEASTTTESAATTTLPPASDPDVISVIIDTDVSIDDLMAIPYLLRRPDIEIEAVTVTGTGIAYCDAGTELVLGILAVSERSDIPVACGSENPVEGINAFPADWRMGMDLLAESGLFPSDSEPVDADAVELLSEAIRNSANPPVILLLGPHTNLGAALMADPGLESSVGGIYMMGGAVNTAGNTFDNPNAEWNLWIDPVADDVVFQTDVPMSIVPLDATNSVPLTTFFADRLAEHLTTPEAQAVYDLVTEDPSTLRSGLSFWDQLAAVVMLVPEVATWQEMDVTVLQVGGPTGAGTLASGIGRPASVAMAADREAFESEYLSTLAGEQVAASEWSTDATITVDGTLTWTYDGPATVSAGPATLLVDNQSEHSVLAALGRLTGDATIEDLDAWQSTQQPPFLEVDSWVLADPRIQAIWEIEYTGQGDAVLIGLDLTDEVPVWNTPVAVDP